MYATNIHHLLVTYFWNWNWARGVYLWSWDRINWASWPRHTCLKKVCHPPTSPSSCPGTISHFCVSNLSPYFLGIVWLKDICFSLNSRKHANAVAKIIYPWPADKAWLKDNLKWRQTPSAHPTFVGLLLANLKSNFETFRFCRILMIRS